MARVRLRPARSTPEEREYYARTYPQGYRHDVWPDHVERVGASVEMICRYARSGWTAADLSAGDGAILRSVPDLGGVWFGDLNGVQGIPEEVLSHPHVSTVPPGALPANLWALPEGDLPVDLYVLSETLEHMDDPDYLLRQLTHFSQYLFLSTPLSESADSGNLEHYWSWDQADLHQMLQAAGWSPLELKILRPVSTQHIPDAYTYQLWMAVNRHGGA